MMGALQLAPQIDNKADSHIFPLELHLKFNFF